MDTSLSTKRKKNLHFFHKVNSPGLIDIKKRLSPDKKKKKKKNSKKEKCKQQLQSLEHREAGKQMRVFKSTGGILNAERMGHILSMVGGNSVAECLFRDYLFWRLMLVGACGEVCQGC